MVDRFHSGHEPPRGSLPIGRYTGSQYDSIRTTPQALDYAQNLTSPVTFAVIDTRIVSLHNPDITFYTISKPLNTDTSILTLSSLHMMSGISSVGSAPLYTLEYLGEDNAVYIRSQSSSLTSYPGFGQLKNSRHLTGKRWELRYEDGKNLVLSRRTEKEQQEYDQKEAKIVTKWFDVSGTALATETEQGLELIKGLKLGDQIAGLLVAAWAARIWHMGTAERRALIDAGAKEPIMGSSKRRDWNRFFANLASGI